MCRLALSMPPFRLMHRPKQALRWANMAEIHGRMAVDTVYRKFMIQPRNSPRGIPLATQ